MAADRALIAAVHSELAARADAVKAPQMQRYMKSALPFYGVPSPGQKAVARAVFPAHPLPSFDAWHDTALALWREAERREERYLALALVGDRPYRPHRTMAALPLYEELVVTGAWWDHVDDVGVRLLGELLRRDHDALAPVLRAWARDASLWKRRAALVAQVKLRQDTDLALLHDVIEPNLRDRDFFMRKGIGWALRAYAWVDPDEVERYCERHAAELSPLSRREALRNVARGATRRAEPRSS